MHHQAVWWSFVSLLFYWSHLSSSRLENVSRTKELPVLECVSSLTCPDGIIITQISDNFCIMLNLGEHRVHAAHRVSYISCCICMLILIVCDHHWQLQGDFRVMFNRTTCYCCCTRFRLIFCDMKVLSYEIMFSGCALLWQLFTFILNLKWACLVSLVFSKCNYS